MDEDEEIYSRIVHSTEDFQVRLTINRFRGTEYLHLRKYYLDFSEEWMPTKDGVAMPLDLENSKELFIGLVEILSLAESKDVILSNFKELIQDIYQ
jgi:hypothetical protein